MPQTTCDIYRAGNTPPADPEVAGVGIFLEYDWVRGQESGDRGANTLTWTHKGYVGLNVDIRDFYGGDAAGANQDEIYIPDKTGTRFKVVFTEKKGNQKLVYLDRRTPSWPTNNI